jgi:hypothetical protein
MNGKKIKFKFGDIIINHHASKDNPQRQGIFVNYDKNTIVLTDMKGNFWFPLLDNDAILEIKGSVLKEEQPLKSAEEILDKYGCPEIPFDENITMFYPAIINAMKEYASQPTKDTTDEEIQDEAWVQSGLNGWSYNERTRWIEGMKRMRDKMKSNGKI